MLKTMFVSSLYLLGTVCVVSVCAVVVSETYKQIKKKKKD